MRTGVRTARAWVREQPWFYRGRRFSCPICKGSFRRFKPFRGRENAPCPRCGLAERHRILWLYLEHETRLLTGELDIDVLHFAPERILEARLHSLSSLRYVSGDLARGAAMEVMDITAFPRTTRALM